MLTPRILGLASLPLLLAACPRNEAPRAGTEIEAGALPTVPNDVGALTDGGADAASADDVEPVYPIEAKAPVDPLAAKLCAALSELPEKRRAACCSAAPGVVVTSECTRMLSAALRHRAVELGEPDVTACVAAYEQTLAGCDWVGPFPPGPPAACLGIIKGRIEAGHKCRSSLECAGDLRCLGAGPTTSGVCGPPKKTGEICGGSVDTLAGYTRQSDVDLRHPECSGKCIRHKCSPPALEGDTCQTTADCGDGLQCIAAPSIGGGGPKVAPTTKKCAARSLPREGEPCAGGVCEGELQCIRNRCAARKPAGEACTADFECRGGCVRDDGGDRGRCGPRCDLR